MKYLQRSFTVPMYSPAYAEGWERIFGRKKKCPSSVKADPSSTVKPPAK